MLDKCHLRTCDYHDGLEFQEENIANDATEDDGGGDLLTEAISDDHAYCRNVKPLYIFHYDV